MSPVNLLKYSNGWGHVIMSLSLLITGIILILMRDAATTGVGIGLITTVAGYWFISSAANTQQMAAAQPPPSPPTTGAPPNA